MSGAGPDPLLKCGSGRGPATQSGGPERGVYGMLSCRSVQVDTVNLTIGPMGQTKMDHACKRTVQA